jgi:hypothetical protein
MPKDRAALETTNVRELTACQTAGQEWAESANELAVTVRSVVILEEFNVLLNPNHRDYGKLVWSNPRHFVLVQPEMEKERIPVASKFRPLGGDFQGMRVYRSDGIWGGAEKGNFRSSEHRLDEPTRLSLGMVASPRSPPFHPAKSL